MSDASSNQHCKASFELDLGRIGFVVIIPVMLWVFYTTFSGLVDIMRKGPDDNFGPIGAVIGATAIPSLMALSSWLLSSELAAAIAGRPFSSACRRFFPTPIITLTCSIYPPRSSPQRRNPWNWPWP